MPTNQSSRIYYQFSSQYYEDLNCSIFNNSINENNYCDKNNFNSIEECCNFIAEFKNITLNDCDNSIKYTCDIINNINKIEKQTDLCFEIIILISILFLIFMIISCSKIHRKISKDYPQEFKYFPLNT